jgi:hypothetical protein
MLAVRSIPNKLLLLGLLMVTTAVLLGVFMPETRRLVIALLIPVIVLVFFRGYLPGHRLRG